MLLRAEDHLPHRPQRILVAGPAGAGKTHLAAQVGRVLDVPHVEIDALFHGPDWTPRDSFAEDVDAFSARPTWITEWQYAAVRPLLAARADLMIWLDLPRATVLRQVSARTIRRRRSRQVLWNGNVEPPLRTIFTDPEHIVRWSWTTYAASAERVDRLRAERPKLPIVHLTSRREIREWLDGAFQHARVRPE